MIGQSALLVRTQAATASGPRQRRSMNRIRHRRALRCVGSTIVLWTMAAAALGQPTQQDRSLAEILLGDTDRSTLQSGNRRRAELQPAPRHDVDKLTSLGFRRLSGKYLELWTDLPAALMVDQLPLAFDLAVEQWANYFGVRREDYQQWRVVGYLMGDEAKFQAAGLRPNSLPDFLNGFQSDHEFWVKEQPSNYYRRHLILHEGVHAFMQKHLGGGGPPWYREGIAELLATHRWRDGRLQVRVMPASRDEVPYWGRIKILRSEFAAERALMLADVVRLDNADFLENTAYGWSWGAAAYLDGHPKARRIFRRLRNHVNDSSMRFTRLLETELAPQLREFDEQWQLFVVNADYGYDFAAESVMYGAGRPLEAPRQVRLRTDRGWQSSGVRVEAGQVYLIRGEGQYKIQQKPETMWCESGGVTIRYYRGMPLGVLMGSVRLDTPRPGLANLCNPMPLGVRRHIRPIDSGTLYLRVNDAPGELSDNSGEITVTIERAAKTANDSAAQLSDASTTNNTKRQR